MRARGMPSATRRSAISLAAQDKSVKPGINDQFQNPKADDFVSRFEREGRAFFERVRSAYLAAAKADPGRVRVIDSTHSLDVIRTELRGILAGL